MTAQKQEDLETRLRTLLRDERIRSEMIQAELADQLGEPQSFISKYENGERRLTFLEVRAICAALGRDFQDFVAEFEAGTNEGS